MVLKLLLIAMFAGTAASAAILVFSGPLWLVLLAYPAIGMVTLLGAVALASLSSNRSLIDRSRVSPPLSAHCPVPRNTTPTVANSTLISVASESLRS